MPFANHCAGGTTLPRHTPVLTSVNGAAYVRPRAPDPSLCHPEQLTCLWQVKSGMNGARLALSQQLQHFHFWCLQSDRTRRGFSSRKDALRCPVLFRVEVKML